MGLICFLHCDRLVLRARATHVGLVCCCITSVYHIYGLLPSHNITPNSTRKFQPRPKSRRYCHDRNSLNRSNQDPLKPLPSIDRPTHSTHQAKARTSATPPKRSYGLRPGRLEQGSWVSEPALPNGKPPNHHPVCPSNHPKCLRRRSRPCPKWARTRCWAAKCCNGLRPQPPSRP